MIALPPCSTLTDTLFPYNTRFRSNAIRLRCRRGELRDRQVPVERRLVVPVNALLLPWQIGQRPRHLLVHADTRPGNLVARVATPLDHPGGAEMGRCRCLARLAVRIAVAGQEIVGRVLEVVEVLNEGRAHVPAGLDDDMEFDLAARWEGRRVGKEGVVKGKIRW